MNNRITLCVVVFLLGVCSFVSAEDKSSPGEFSTEPATLHCLAMRWTVKGDQNRNAVIEVSYRKKGEKEWKKGFPLFRTLPHLKGENRSVLHTIDGGWMFAGSIINLEPDTLYEVKCNLKDPDGGAVEKLVEMKTYKEPVEPKGMVVKHVVPGTGGGSGTEADPYKGVDEATKNAKPGTLFLLHKGTYIKDQCPGNTWTIKKSGEPGKPIIFRAAGDGEVIMDGGGDLHTGGRGISAGSTKHIWLEGFTIQGRQYVICAHKASHWVIRRCHFRNMTKGFTAHNGGYTVSRHHYITDNIFEGPTKWPRTRGIEAYCSVYMSGSGHVVAYNTMKNLGDGIHGTSHGSTAASDWHNNDITIATDDGLETDHCTFNMRAYHNRILNVAHGITAQPSRGGPVYIFRNLIYNATYSPFKLHNHTTGILIFHNTCLKVNNSFNIVPAQERVRNLWMRNNLFLCHKGTGLSVGTRNMQECDLDNDGYGGFSRFATWNARHNYKTIEDAKKGGLIYSKLGAILIDPKTCFKSGLLPPTSRDITFMADKIDARLAEKSDAIDKGVVLPNLNDYFTGKAPDLGCYEYGKELPHYGPRPKGFSNVKEIRKFTTPVDKNN